MRIWQIIFLCVMTLAFESGQAAGFQGCKRAYESQEESQKFLKRLTEDDAPAVYKHKIWIAAGGTKQITVTKPAGTNSVWVQLFDLGTQRTVTRRELAAGEQRINWSQRNSSSARQYYVLIAHAGVSGGAEVSGVSVRVNRKVTASNLTLSPPLLIDPDGAQVQVSAIARPESTAESFAVMFDGAGYIIAYRGAETGANLAQRNYRLSTMNAPFFVAGEGIFIAANDHLHDGRDKDGDGVGKMLERGYCACDPANTGTDYWPQYCHNIVSIYKRTSGRYEPEASALDYHLPGYETQAGKEVLKYHAVFEDSDRDGISDFHEIFGKNAYDDNNPVLLPRYGASPVHKDVFVEIDHVQDCPATDFSPGLSFSSPPFVQLKNNYSGENRTQEFAEQFQAMYSEGPAEHLKNPDGEDGVAVHLDLGVDPDTTQPIEIKTLYGDWGGGGDSIPWRDSYRNPTLTQCDKKDFKEVLEQWGFDNRFGSNRKGIFHWAMAQNISGGGQAHHNNQRYRFFLNTSANGGTAGHELGHNLGLGHGGLDEWGNFNCKPHYRSDMNYAYGNLGKFSTSEDMELNPTALSELHSYRTEPEAAYLKRKPWNYTVEQKADGKIWVDWNRDGRANTRKVQAGVFIGGGNCGATIFNSGFAGDDQFTLLSVEKNVTQWKPQSIEIIRAYDDYLFAFWIGNTGRIFYKFASLADGQVDEWYGVYEFVPRMVGFSPSMPFDQIEAIEIGDNLVLGVSAKHGATGQRIIRLFSTHLAGFGGVFVPGWHAPLSFYPLDSPERPNARYGSSFELTRLVIDGQERIGLMTRAMSRQVPNPTTKFRFFIGKFFDGGTGLPSIGWWQDHGELEDEHGNPIEQKGFAPTVLAIPIGFDLKDPVYPYTNCGIFNKETDGLEFRCLKSDAERINFWWEAFPDVFDGDTYGYNKQAEAVGSKVSFAYRYHRIEGGEIAGHLVDKHTLALFVGFKQLDKKSGWIIQSNGLNVRRDSSDTLDDRLGKLQFVSYSRIGEEFNKLSELSPVALYGDLDLHTLKGAFGKEANNNTGLATGVYFLHAADGIIDKTGTTGSDYMAMESRICRSIRGGHGQAASCPSKDSGLSFWGY